MDGWEQRWGRSWKAAPPTQRLRALTTSGNLVHRGRAERGYSRPFVKWKLVKRVSTVFAREHSRLSRGCSKADLEDQDLRASEASIYWGGDTKKHGLGGGSQARMGRKPAQSRLPDSRFPPRAAGAHAHCGLLQEHTECLRVLPPKGQEAGAPCPPIPTHP